MLRQLTLNRSKILRLQFLGDRSTLAFTNLAAVQFTDGQYFGGGAGEEGFIADIQLVASDAPLAALDAFVGSVRCV